jgi:hypothetical protein
MLALLLAVLALFCLVLSIGYGLGRALLELEERVEHLESVAGKAERP